MATNDKPNSWRHYVRTNGVQAMPAVCIHRRRTDTDMVRHQCHFHPCRHARTFCHRKRQKNTAASRQLARQTREFLAGTAEQGGRNSGPLGRLAPRRGALPCLSIC